MESFMDTKLYRVAVLGDDSRYITFENIHARDEHEAAETVRKSLAIEAFHVGSTGGPNGRTESRK